jgi:glycerol-3-phosphate acyltransferase PlsY
MIIMLCVSAYLLGSIPFAFLITKWLRGFDIRKVGSLNPGAANVITQAGRGAGALVVVLDFGKGLLPVVIAQVLRYPLWVISLAGILTVIGHCWSVYMIFDGGEGVMTAMGVLVALAPAEFAFALAAAVITGFFSKYLEFRGWFGSRINLGSVVGFAVFFFFLIHWRKPLMLIAAVVVLTVILIMRQLQVSRTHLEDF